MRNDVIILSFGMVKMVVAVCKNAISSCPTIESATSSCSSSGSKKYSNVEKAFYHEHMRDEEAGAMTTGSMVRVNKKIIKCTGLVQSGPVDASY